METFECNRCGALAGVEESEYYAMGNYGYCDVCEIEEGNELAKGVLYGYGDRLNELYGVVIEFNETLPTLSVNGSTPEVFESYHDLLWEVHFIPKRSERNRAEKMIRELEETYYNYM